MKPGVAVLGFGLILAHFANSDSGALVRGTISGANSATTPGGIDIAATHRAFLTYVGLFVGISLAVIVADSSPEAARVVLALLFGTWLLFLLANAATLTNWMHKFGLYTPIKASPGNVARPPYRPVVVNTPGVTRRGALP